MTEVVEIYNESRASQVRNNLINISQRVIKDFCELAELLHEVWDGEYHKEYGYKSFTDYVEAELDIKGRKAYSLVQTAKIIKKLQISWEDVKEVGWRKMGTISPVLTHENHEKLIEDAKSIPLPQLSENVKAQKNGTEPSDTPYVKLNFQFDEDQNSIFQAAIEYAKRHEDVKSTSQAITHICYHWIQANEE